MNKIHCIPFIILLVSTVACLPISQRTPPPEICFNGIDYLFMYWFGRTYDLIP